MGISKIFVVLVAAVVLMICSEISASRELGETNTVETDGYGKKGQGQYGGSYGNKGHGYGSEGSYGNKGQGYGYGSSSGWGGSYGNKGHGSGSGGSYGNKGHGYGYGSSSGSGGSYGNKGHGYGKNN